MCRLMVKGRRIYIVQITIGRLSTYSELEPSLFFEFAIEPRHLYGDGERSINETLPTNCVIV